MVQATRSLSPKRAAEMMQRFRSAVITVARLRARQIIKAQIKARGEKIYDFTAAQISLEADAYLAQPREELITKAAIDVANFPDFIRWRADILSVAQSQTPLNSMASAVQMSGAK